nr:hypothetical protein [Tanacetum cinerariifolium]
MVLITKTFKNIYKPTKNKPWNIIKYPKNINNSSRIERLTGQYDNQRAITVLGARDTIGTQVVHQGRIQCFNYKGFGHYAKECRAPKRDKDYAYHKEKMLLCKKQDAWIQLSAEQEEIFYDINEEPTD